MSTDKSSDYYGEACDDTPGPDYTLPIARAGEQQFGAIVRNRSGMDAGNIDFGARFIDGLSDVDQRDAVEAAYALYETFCDQTHKRARRDTKAAQ